MTAQKSDARTHYRASNETKRLPALKHQSTRRCKIEAARNRFARARSMKTRSSIRVGADHLRKYSIPAFAAGKCTDFRCCFSATRSTFVSRPWPRSAQLTIGPGRRVRRVQWTHWRGNRRCRIDDANTLVHPERLVRPRGERRRFRCARPVVEMEVYEIEVPLQLSEHLENLRIVEPVHFHRELRNRREQFVWRCEKRFPFPAFDVHLDNH